MKNNIYWQLFSSFFKIGGFTFGGGWAMISLIEKEVVDRHGWIDREEFLNQLAIAQSLPGILAVNISVAVGDKLKGMRGSICAATGTIILPFLIILAIAHSRSYKKQRDRIGYLQRHTSGCDSFDNRTGAHLGQISRNLLENTVDTRSCGTAYLVKATLDIQSNTFHHTRWCGRLLFPLPPRT